MKAEGPQRRRDREMVRQREKAALWSLCLTISLSLRPSVSPSS
jgi:hypothetical protein